MLSKWAFRFLVTGVILDLAISIVLAITLVNVNRITQVSNCWDHILKYAVTHPVTKTMTQKQITDRTTLLLHRANGCALLGKGK